MSAIGALMFLVALGSLCLSIRGGTSDGQSSAALIGLISVIRQIAAGKPEQEAPPATPDTPSSP